MWSILTLWHSLFKKLFLQEILFSVGLGSKCWGWKGGFVSSLTLLCSAAAVLVRAGSLKVGADLASLSLWLCTHWRAFVSSSVAGFMVVLSLLLHHNLPEHCYYIIEETVRFSDPLHRHFHFLITKIDLLAVVWKGSDHCHSDFRTGEQ